jgi:hypothetical protein
MERFALTIVAQGPHSIWIALLVVAPLCMTAFATSFLFCARRRPPMLGRWDSDLRCNSRPGAANPKAPK